MIKAQVGIEFITVFLLVFLIFIFLQVGNFFTSSNLEEQNVPITANNLLAKAAILIDLTGHSNALSTQFTLPSYLPGALNYSFGVSNTSIYITWNGTKGVQTSQRGITVFNITNSTGATNFFLTPGTHYVVKTQQGVRIT